jgi:hypothetical protein
MDIVIVAPLLSRLAKSALGAVAAAADWRRARSVQKHVVLTVRSLKPMIDPLQNAGVVETATEEARPEEERPVEVLLRLAARAGLFRAADGRLHARVPVGDRHEICGLKTAAFRDWLIGGYYADQGEPASDWAIRRVVGVL